jgi:ribosomal protein L37E
MTTVKTKKEIHWRCKKCGDEIYWNAHKEMIMCKCGALGPNLFFSNAREKLADLL